MKDQDLTPAQKRAATKERKKKAMLENLGVDSTPTPKKPRKKRKPMTEEQRAAAVERLAKARAAKAPAKNTSIHPSVLALPDDHALSAKVVKEWLKYNKDYLKAIKQQATSKNSKERLEYQATAAYVKNLGVYLKDSVWLDEFYGQKRDKKIERVCLAMAYDKQGQPKRSLGVYYPDIRETWTKELREEMNNVR